MKGVILSINPAVRIVDVSHAIPPQDIRQGAIVLADVDAAVSRGHDPRRGRRSRRRHVASNCLRRNRRRSATSAPTTGSSHGWRVAQKPSKMRCITAEQWFRRPVAPTFHGRDIMAPVAAHLSLGLDPDELGPAAHGTGDA